MNIIVIIRISKERTLRHLQENETITLKIIYFRNFWPNIRKTSWRSLTYTTFVYFSRTDACALSHTHAHAHFNCFMCWYICALHNVNLNYMHIHLAMNIYVCMYLCMYIVCVSVLSHNTSGRWSYCRLCCVDIRAWSAPYLVSFLT